MGLQKEKNELSAQLSLSQQLNSPHIDSQNIVAPIFTKQHSQTNGNTEERLQRINSLISQSVENLDLEKIKKEIEILMEEFHPINIAKTQNSETHSFELINNDDKNGSYVLTESEYKDIERCIDERDQYLHKISYYQQNIKSLTIKYEALQKRFVQINEEKSLMMLTLKQSVEQLSNENNAIKTKLASLNDERSSIKEHDLKTQNDFYRIFEENKERKFEMQTMQKRIDSLLRDTETFKYLSQQLKDANNKQNDNLTNSLERIDKLVEDKEAISKKLRESNKLTMELLKERSNASSVKQENEENEEKKEEANDLQSKYEKVLMEKLNFERMYEENDCTVNELTNQIISLEQKLQSLVLENELLKKEIVAISADNEKKTNQIKSAQRVALSIMQSNKEERQRFNHQMNDSHKNNVQKDMFGLQPPPEPDLITSLLTYLLPFLFEEDDQPKIV